jgi:hypothetical protein
MTNNYLALFYFILTKTWSLSTVVGTIENDDDEKCWQITGNLDHHADAAVRCGAHLPMEHTPGFTRSHWMSPSSKCLHSIAVAAAMVDGIGAKHKLNPLITSKRILSTVVGTW